MGERNDLVENEDACYLLVKRGLYYRPDRQGYTGIKEKAGRYTRADGEQLSRSGVSFVHVDEAEEYSPSCNAETKADHLQAVLADRDATIASLSEALAEAEKKGAEDKRRLDWLEANRSAEISHESFEDDVWQIHFVNGNRNDREWTKRAEADTVRAAIDAAIRAAPPRDLSQGGQHG